MTVMLVACDISLSVYVREEVEDPTSPLLEAVDCRSTLKFLEKWTWDSLLITQGRDQNDDEFARCFYVGHYENKEQSIRNNIQFSYRVIFPTDRVVDRSEVLVNDFTATDKFDLEIVPVGDSEFINCEKDKEQYSCLVIAQYKSAILFLRFWGDGAIDADVTRRLINSTLLRLDEEIREVSRSN
jgi:hypothetical protein